jgi:hypothetical protein
MARHPDVWATRVRAELITSMYGGKTSGVDIGRRMLHRLSKFDSIAHLEILKRFQLRVVIVFLRHDC